MRNRALHDALRDFALEAAALLSADLEAGAELPFEIEEEPGGGTILYRYRPLTGAFVEERWARLRSLPTREGATRALGAGAAAWLRHRGERGSDAEPALQALLERLFEDASGFAFPEERFEAVYGEVEGTLYRGATHTEVVAPLTGARLEEPRVEVAPGLALVSGDTVDAPSEAVWPGGDSGPAVGPSVLCVLERDVSPDGPMPLEEARAMFRALQNGLRLWSPGGLALDARGWVRADSGAWRSFPLGPVGAARGEPWTLRAGEGAELREFIATLGRSRQGGAVAWALSRFEMGCEREHDLEALSDYLLALEVLLGSRADAGQAGFSLRLAALCAEERDRRTLQRRLELAFALERFVIAAGGEDAYLEKVSAEAPGSLVIELEEHLRGLLRDVLCGHLDSDLRRVADDILLESSEPIEIRARDTREERGRAASVEEDEHEPVEPEEGRGLSVEENGFDDVAHGEGEVHRDVDLGVTPSDDWALDEDASSYSAPV